MRKTLSNVTKTYQDVHVPRSFVYRVDIPVQYVSQDKYSTVVSEAQLIPVKIK